MTLDPTGFSRHLLYHTSNNKQRVRKLKRQFSGRSINQFWGQLNTIRKNAEAAMRNELLEQQLQLRQKPLSRQQKPLPRRRE
jgi:hypothetical protein